MEPSITFKLSHLDIQKWRAALSRDRKGREKYPLESHIKNGLDRYPGQLGRGDTFQDKATDIEKLDHCLEQIYLENEDFSRSFLLRVLESCWSDEDIRVEIVDKTPALVRPHSGFGTTIQPISDAITAMLNRLAAAPRRNALGDARIYRLICTNRDQVLSLSKALVVLEAEKAFHDALQQLQVHGDEWLDSAPPDDADEPGPPAILAGLTLGAAQAIHVVMPNLSARDSVAARRCLDALNDAGARLGSGKPDEITLAINALRAMLFRELPEIAEAMFQTCRDLPLREIRAVFAGQDQVIIALVEFCDRLRRCMMAHSLWQTCDLKVSTIEQLFANPTPTLFADLRAHISTLRVCLAVLMEIPEQQPGPTEELGDRLFEYGESLPEGVEPETLDVAPASWRKALGDLREIVRTKFLEENQKLTSDIQDIIRLNEPLRLMLRRVSQFCDQNL
jgi:hypothetical protein